MVQIFSLIRVIDFSSLRRSAARFHEENRFGGRPHFSGVGSVIAANAENAANRKASVIIRNREPNRCRQVN